MMVCVFSATISVRHSTFDMSCDLSSQAMGFN